MGSALSRRRFVRATGLATAGLVGSSLVDPKLLFGANTPFVRRNVGNIDANNPIITSYKTAIAAMQALPNTDPTSWAYQAAIHGTTLSGSLPAWNTCQHGATFFLSWHRMYLYWFERIVRKKSGDPNWAIPYWDWESPTQRFLPPMFRTGGGVLTIPTRGAGWNAGTASLGAGAVNTAPAMSQIPFLSFSSSLNGPHGSIHVSIGGWMGSVATAGQDPIFWLHHCNVDRYWNLWLAQGGGRTMPLGSSAADLSWKNTQFTFFDEDGKEVKMTGCEVLRAQDQLGYVYECEPVQVKKFCRLIVFPAEWVIDVIQKFPERIIIRPLPDPPPFVFDIAQVRERLRGIADDSGADVTLELSDIEADRQPDVFWEVYVGLPTDAKPNANSPHFVGQLALFGQGIRDEKTHSHDREPVSMSFKIDRALTAVLRRNPELSKLRVTLVPRGAELREGTFKSEVNATLTIGSAALAVRRLKPGREEQP